MTLVLLFVLLLIAHGIWSSVESRRLNDAIGKLKEESEPVAIAELVGARLAESRNGAIDLRAAAAAIDMNADPWHEFQEAEPAFPLREEELKILRQFAPLAKQSRVHLANARRKKGVDWQMNFTSPVRLNLSYPDITPQRALAMLLAREALLAHQNGDDNAALDLIEDVLFISNAVDEQSTFISHLVSLGMTALATNSLIEIAPDLRVGSENGAVTSERLHALIDQLLDDAQLQSGMARAARFERVFELDGAQSVISGDTTPKFFGPSGIAGVVRYLFKPLLYRDARLMLQDSSAVVQASDANGVGPFAQRVGRSEIREGDPPYMHPVAYLFQSSMARAARQQYLAIATRRMGAIALAAREYAVRHEGVLPAAGEQLVPGFLPSWPADPLTNTVTGLKWVNTPGRAIIYSVGMNGKDDGGREINEGMSYREQRDFSDEVRRLRRVPRPAPATEPTQAETNE